MIIVSDNPALNIIQYTRMHTTPTHTTHTHYTPHTHTHTHTLHTHRRLIENGEPPQGALSDAKAAVLESIAREAGKKEAKIMAETARQEYMTAEAKTRSQEETMRKVHQKQADRAMDVSGCGLCEGVGSSKCAV